MKVRTRILLLAITWFVLVSLGMIGARNNEEDYLQVLYDDRQEQMDQFVRRMVEQDGKVLEHLVMDYAYSDEMFLFARNASGLATQRLLSDITLRDIDVVWILSKNGRLIKSVSQQIQEPFEKEVSFPSLLLAELEENPGGLHFFLLTPGNQIIEVYGSAIYPQKSSFPNSVSSGYLFAGRRWDADHLVHLAQLLDGEVRLIPLMAAQPPGSRPLRTVPEEVIIYAPLLSWDGQPLLRVLRVHFALPIVAAVLRSSDQFIILLISLISLFTIALGLAMYSWIYVPLRQTAASLAANSVAPLSGLLNSKTEFGNMAQLIQRSFQFQAEMDAEIARREQVELAYLREQEFALAILNSVNSIIVVVDPQGKVVRCNPACEQVVGVPFEEFQGQYIWDIFSSVGGDLISQKEYQRVVAEQIIIHQETFFSIRNGEQSRWIEWWNGFIFDTNDEMRYVVLTGVDVDARKQRERQEAAIAALASDLRGPYNRHQTMQAIVDRTVQFLQCDLIALSILHRPGSPSDVQGGNLKITTSLHVNPTSKLVIEEAAGVLAKEVLGWQIALDHGPRDEFLNNGRPYLTDQPQDQSAWLREDVQRQLASLGIVPMLVEGNPLGLLIAGSQQPIEPNDFQLLIAIADIAASAIHRCILSDAMQQQIHRLKALHTINVAISASLDVQVTLQLLVGEITSQLGVDAAVILLTDPQTRDLRFAAAYGFRSKEVENLHYWLGEGKPGQVALYRNAIHLYDPEGIDYEFSQQPWIKEENFVAYAGVPLTNQGEVLGVLETFHRAPYVPDPDWLRFLDSLALQTSLAINHADLFNRLQRSNLELERAYDATITGWARALELRDEDTEGHTQRVTEWTVRLAQGMGIIGEELVHIRRGALLHDIGKMGIPDGILRKKGPLSPEEWVLMRQHPRYAYDMLSAIEFLRPALVIPYSHHEHWDGSGYPQGLAGRQIPFTARIFAVVDVWDALYHGRPYRPPMVEAEVLEYLISESGKHFDPEVVRAFIQMRTVLEKRT